MLALVRARCQYFIDAMLCWVMDLGYKEMISCLHFILLAALMLLFLLFTVGIFQCIGRMKPLRDVLGCMWNISVCFRRYHLLLMARSAENKANRKMPIWRHGRSWPVHFKLQKWFFMQVSSSKCWWKAGINNGKIRRIQPLYP